MIKDWKNISYFKRAILIGSRTCVYFNQNRYTLIKIKGTESWKKNERNLLCLKEVLLEKRKPQNNQKIFNSECAESLGQCPVQY